jgi:hypothetical protein
MDAFATPSTRAETTPRSGFLGLQTLAIGLALGLSLVGGSLAAPDSSLDASWQAMLIHAHAEGLQFGRDVIYTWGPWGFLCNGYHLGSLAAGPILAWQVAGQLGIGLALALLTRGLAAWRRIAFAAAFLALHWLFLDTAIFVLIALITLSALMGRGSPLVRMVAWTLVLGFVSQLKFTYMILSAAAVLASMACWTWRGSPGRAGALACGYAAAVAASWIAAGQSLDNLYPYVMRSLEISSGYAEAMGVDEPWGVFLWGSGLALLCALFLWRSWRRAPERAFGACACGFLAFLLFVVWKESFIRADLVPLGGHVFGFFTTVIILGPVLPGLVLGRRRFHWFDVAPILGLAAVACFDGAYYALAPRVAWQRIYGNVRTLGDLAGRPGEWQRSLEESRSVEALPAVQAAVGRGTVDVYDFNAGKALLNGLNLGARPIFQSYQAYTPSLEGYNLRFFQSARAPEFLLWSGDPVDSRYPGEDDAMLVAALPGHYEPVLSEGGYWLFRRLAPVSTDPLRLDRVLERRVSLDDEVELPLEADQAIWLRARAAPNNLGRIRSLLYKPARIDIATTDYRGQRRVWRLVPRLAEFGFILAPTLASGADLAALMRGDASSWVRSFHFEAPDGQAEFWSHVDVELFRMPGLPFNSPSPVSWLVDLGIFDRAPLSIKSQEFQQVLGPPELPQRALLLHAEGEMVFATPPGASRFSGSFGIRRGAYTGDGRTKGVEFSIEGLWASGRRELLWRRRLDPVAEEGDRGTQSVALDLPADRPAKLVLHTGAGPEHDNRWDWSYVTALRFDAPGEK